MDLHQILPPAATAGTRAAVPGRPPRFVTRRAEKTSPARHKISTCPCNLQEEQEVTLTKIKHSHPGKNASHASQATGAHLFHKTSKMRLPISSRPPNPKK
ncbi:hypothetical protein SBA6_1260015 [Candidatus Sulfopaludibacter sp. SbA6]|nr:hypothetical protein SBA6_1260015 [Candidatus Sulfopaludibacter sp. SbA6]